jgi:hypothetical protein
MKPNKRKRQNSKPLGVQESKNFYEKGQKYKFHLLNGQSFAATVVALSTYDLKVWLVDGKIAILPKHAVVLAEVV